MRKGSVKMGVSRRGFIGILGAAAAAPGLFAKAPSDYDPNLTVLLSDLHVNGTSDSHQLGRLERAVGEILALNPLPARAVVFGDIACMYGRKEDYQRAATALKRLEDAGIPVALGVGNHDRRSTFLETHPGYAARTKVPGRIVTVCDAGTVDFLMLDGLQGTDDRAWNDMGPLAGQLDKAQEEWLLSALPAWKKPVFVCSHYPIGDLSAGGQPLSRLLARVPAVVGYIHGHDHRWYTRDMGMGWKKTGAKRTLCLPSTGAWGDIGYALLRTSRDRAVASLVQREFYYPRPPKPGMPVQHLWNAIVKANQNQTCAFAIPENI